MWSVSDETSSFSYGIDCLGVDWVGKFLVVLVILEGHVTELVLPYPGAELAEETPSCARYPRIESIQNTLSPFVLC